jgi:hypothetical protein
MSANFDLIQQALAPLSFGPGERHMQIELACSFQAFGLLTFGMGARECLLPTDHQHQRPGLALRHPSAAQKFAHGPFCSRSVNWLLPVGSKRLQF